MSREMDESNGHLVLRHLKAIAAWSAALATFRKYISVINGKLDINLVQVSHAGGDIDGVEVITDEYFKQFLLCSFEKFRWAKLRLIFKRD